MTHISDTKKNIVKLPNYYFLKYGISINALNYVYWLSDIKTHFPDEGIPIQQL